MVIDYGQAGLEACAQGDYIQALHCFEQAIRQNNQLGKLWNYRGNALAELKRYGEALGAYDRAIALQRDYHQAWYNRGLVLLELGAYGNSLESFNQAINLYPDPVYIHRRETIWLKKHLVPFF
jgi:tetratricopeptide (TPR) repeat protein